MAEEKGSAAFDGPNMPIDTQFHHSGHRSVIMQNSLAANARPPRAPKPSSQSREEQKLPPPHHHFRSSSQPRPSLSADACNIVSARSMSQPRASQSHFLEGFNVADCFDVRSIPDPPSPIVPNRSRSRHRRLSTPIMMSSSTSLPCTRGLGDVTNNLEGETTSTKKNGSNRKRKSLIHVPAPQEDDDSSPVMNAEMNETNSMELLQPKTLKVNICLEEEETEQVRSSPKRRKKRQSMVLPSPLVLSQQEDASLPSPTRTSSRPGERNPSHSSTRPAFLGTLESMEELRALVRGYCAMTDVEKSTTGTADEIRAMTRYPMPGGIPSQNNAEPQNVETDQRVIIANRRRVFSKISPAMAEMEKQKEQDTKQWERDTGCRVGKSNKSGKYRYFSIEDNQRVASQEYKRRYVAVLEEDRHVRATAAQAWMEKLANVNVAPYTSKGDAFDMSMPDLACDREIREQYLPDLQTYTQAEEEQRMAFLPPKSNLVRSESSGSRADDTMNSDMHVRGQATDEIVETPVVAEISEASSEDTEEREGRSDTPSPLPLEFVARGCCEEAQPIGPVLVAHSRDEGLDEGETEACAEGARTRDQSPAHEHLPLLPLPSREVESLDPDIALAEKRLWDKIDEALKEYSEEVMMIRSSKKSRVEG